MRNTHAYAGAALRSLGVQIVEVVENLGIGGSLQVAATGTLVGGMVRGTSTRSGWSGGTSAADRRQVDRRRRIVGRR